MTDVALAPKDVVLTDRAARRIGKILAKQGEGTVLRIQVAGGGCSGFQYEYKLGKDSPTADDLVLTKGDKIYIHKFRTREGYRRKTGHRQKYTQVKITAING